MAKKTAAILTVVLVLSMFVTLNAASADGKPALYISKDSGCVGDILTVSGENFAQDTFLTIETFRYQTTIDKTGTFSGELTIPGEGYLSAGTYDIVARDEKGNEAHTAFTMLPSLTATPNYGPAGSKIHLHGDCLTPGKEYFLDILFDDKILTTTDKFPMGVLDIDIAIPDSVESGDHKITAAPWGGNSAYTSFTLKDGDEPYLTITDVSNGDSHKNGYVGDTLLFSGSGFKADNKIRIYTDDTLTTAMSDKNGEFKTDYKLPEMAGGNIDIYATDESKTADSTFKVLPSITLTPTIGAVGSQVVVVGNGFSADPISDKLAATLNSGKIKLDHLTGEGLKGHFVVTFTVPQALPGVYTIKLSCVADPTIQASNSFSVSALVATPENPIGTLIILFACLASLLIVKKKHR